MKGYTGARQHDPWLHLNVLRLNDPAGLAASKPDRNTLKQAGNRRVVEPSQKSTILVGLIPTKCIPLEADLDFATATEVTLCTLMVVSALGLALMTVELFKELPSAIPEHEQDDPAAS